MKAKTALISGGSSGVGLSLVKALAKENYNVFFIGSNKEKGMKIEHELRTVHSEKIEFIQLDLSDLNSVKLFANDFIRKNESLDLLVCSAGVVIPKRTETIDGLEKTFSIGYLSAYLLSKELLPILSKPENSRILFVSGSRSIALKFRLNYSNLNFVRYYNGFMVAGKTVHAKAVLADILSTKYASKNIDVNAFSPGMVKSDLTRNLTFPLNYIMKYLSILSPKSSKTGVRASIDSSMLGVTGKFIDTFKQTPLMFDESYKDQLTYETESMLSGILN